MASRSYLTAAALLCTACILHAAPARADITSFLSMGGGAAIDHNHNTKSYEGAGGMTFALGVGTDPSRKIVLAGIIREATFFNLGTDLNLAARVATGGFARGQWGIAGEIGPGWRSFGHGEYGRWPIFAQATLGAPWGFQLGVGAEVLKIAGNDPSAIGFQAVLELDLLRLTVMRQGATDLSWPNPSPAGGHMQQGKNGPLAGLLW